MNFVLTLFPRRCRVGALLLPATGLCLLTPALSQQSGAPVAPTGASIGRRASAPAARPGISRSFARLPVAFEHNQGQADHRVQFLVRQPHSTLFLTPTEAVFTFDAPRSRVTSPSSTLSARSHISRAAREVRTASVLRMQMVGANGRAEAVGEQALPGKVNSFVGRDRRRWQAGASTFAQARYKGVYHGIDMVYYGSRQHLEYDFVLAPHADPRQIALRFAGAGKVRVDRAGDMEVQVQGRTLTWQRPTVYQESRTGRQRVACGYAVSRDAQGNPTVRFALGRYDAGRPLVIDPALVYSTFFGGSVGESGNGIAVDSAGSAYITGSTSSADFPTTSGAFQATNTSRARANAFVTKLNANGTALVYSTYLGGTAYESGNAIAVDSSGNAYVTGETDSADFPTTSGARQKINFNGTTAFVTKLNATGAALLYSTYLGGSIGDTGNGIAINGAGNAYITGYTSSTDFPVTYGAYQRTNHSSFNTNAFVTKLNAAGTGLVYSTYIGGSGYESGNGIAIDSAENVYITGYSGSTDFPTTDGAYQKTNHSSNTNAFVTKLNTTGTGLVYSTYLGGSVYESGRGIALDSAGDAYVTGYTGSADFPTTTGAYQPANTSAGGSSAFVTKLNPNGTALLCSTFLGGTGYEAGSGIALDSAGNVYITGYTVSTDFPTTAGANQTTKRDISAGLYAFVTKMAPACTSLLYSTYLGGTVGDRGNGIALDSSGNIYITGSAASLDFPITAGVYQGTNKGVRDGNAFITKLNPNVAIPRVSTDLNNDGKSDLFFQNPSTGQISAWYMNAFNRVGGAEFTMNPGTACNLIGNGDFKGDGTFTLVLQNQTNYSIVYWYCGGVNHATVTGGDNVSATPAAGWNVVGIGDFNADGKSDIVLQSQATNQIALWYMNGPYYSGGALMSVTPLEGWLVVGTGDFNGDGNPDIVFQNQNTGQIVIWYMVGGAYVSGTTVNAAVPSGWKVVGVADYNGDGFADLLFQNQATGQGAVWFMNGGSYLGGSVLNTSIAAGWRIAGPQ